LRYRGCLFEESGKREPQLEHAIVPSHGPDAAGVRRSCDDVRGDLTNELIYKTETYSQTQKRNLWSPKGSVWGAEGSFRSLGLTDAPYHKYKK